MSCTEAETREVLLCKAQALALVVVVFRIEDLCDGLAMAFCSIARI